MSFLPLDAPAQRCDAAAMNAEILLFDGFDELDAMGPWEVLAGLASVRDDVTAGSSRSRARATCAPTTAPW